MTTTPHHPTPVTARDAADEKLRALRRRVAGWASHCTGDSLEPYRSSYETVVREIDKLLAEPPSNATPRFEGDPKDCVFPRNIDPSAIAALDEAHAGVRGAPAHERIRDLATERDALRDKLAAAERELADLRASDGPIEQANAAAHSMRMERDEARQQRDEALAKGNERAVAELERVIYNLKASVAEEDRHLRSCVGHDLFDAEKQLAALRASPPTAEQPAPEPQSEDALSDADHNALVLAADGEFDTDIMAEARAMRDAVRVLAKLALAQEGR